MSWLTDLFKKFPNSLGDFDPGDKSLLDAGLYEDTTPEWGKDGQLGDYGRHLFNTSANLGSPTAGYTSDYEHDRQSGDSDYATEEGGENALTSAAILATIFGFGNSSGGEGAAGGGGAESGITTSGLEGTAQGSGATGTPTSLGDGGFSIGTTNYDSAGNLLSDSGSASGSSSGGLDYSKFLSAALGAMGGGEGGGGSGGSGSQQGSNSINSSDYIVNAGSINPNSQQAAQQSAPADPYAPQQYGAYGAPYEQERRRRMLADALENEDRYG